MGSWKYNNNQFKLTGTIHLSSSAYVNWGDAVTGSAGFGLRANGEDMQVKHGLTGSWQNIAADGVLKADDLDAGDAAVLLTTTAGNITIDAQGNDTDIIFKGTDGSADTTFLTIDGSEAGAATFNGPITCATSLTIGSAAMSEADLEKLDGITDGTAAANKAVVLDGSKNIATIGTVGCGAVTSTGNSSFVQVTTSGRVIVDDATEATTATDGSLQTDGGLSVAKSAVIGDDLDLLSNSAVFKVGSDQPFTLTHSNASNTLMASSGHRLAFGDAGEYVAGDGTDLKIVSSGDVDITGDTDVVGGLSSTQATVLASAAGTTTIGSTTGAVVTAAGVVNVNNATDATSGTDGSLQTDGGLSVVKAAWVGTDLSVGDDLSLTSDSAVFNMGAGNDFTITHDGATGATLAGNPLTLDSAGDLNFDAAGADVYYKVNGNVKAQLIISGSDEGEGYTRLQAGTAGAAHGLRLSASSVISFEGDKGIYLDFESGSSGATIACGSSLGDILFTVDAESGGAEVFRVDNSATSLLMAGTKKIEFTNGDAYINHDGTDLQLVDNADINIKPATDFLVDAGNDIILDSDNGEWLLKDGGTDVLHILHGNSGDMTFENMVSDKDMIFKVNDGGSETEVFRLDGDVSSLLMAGTKKLAFTNANAYINHDGTDLQIVDDADINIKPAANFLVDAGGDIILDADDGVVEFKDGGTLFLELDGATTAGDCIFSDAGETEIFRIDGSADSLLMANTKKIEFTDANAYINHDGTDLQIVDDADINLKPAVNLLVDAGANILLDADGGEVQLLDGGNAFVAFNTGGTQGLCQVENGAGDAVVVIDDGDRRLYFYDKGGEYIVSDGSNLTIESGGSILMGATVSPDSNGGQDLGASGAKWDAVYTNNVYTGDLHLKNERGDWSVIEESNYLTLRHNTSGKRFKLLMEEITGGGNYGPGNDGVM